MSHSHIQQRADVAGRQAVPSKPCLPPKRRVARGLVASWPRDDGRDDGYTLRVSHFVLSIEIAGFNENE
jgi:hypothetical protein